MIGRELARTLYVQYILAIYVIPGVLTCAVLSIALL